MCNTAHSNAASAKDICVRFYLASFYPRNDLTTLPGISTICVNNNTQFRSKLISCGFWGYLAARTKTKERTKDKEKRNQKEELTFSRSEYQYCGLVGCAIIYLFI
jgi:hypothetical protein